MTNRELMELLGKTFETGNPDAITDYLKDDCRYFSDCSGKRFSTAEEIVSHIKDVGRDLTEEDKYSFSIAHMQDIVRDGLFEYFEDFDGQRFNEFAILWHQLEPEYLVAVIAVTQEIESGKISCIELHRNSNYFNVTFGNGNIDETYMWEKADEETKQLLEVRGYRILQTEKFDHYIGYRCQRNGCNYAIYMHARGDNPATIIDGENCSYLLDLELSKDCIVLVLCINVKCFKKGKNIKYIVCDYSGDVDREIDFWRVKTIEDRCILEFYPYKELVDDSLSRLMYAFNNDNIDAYKGVIAKHNPQLDLYDSTGIVLNKAFYHVLLTLHKNRGDMKLGYIRFNDVIYSSVPYIEGYGFFDCMHDEKNNRIVRIGSHPFDDEEETILEFIKTDETFVHAYDVPDLTKIEVLSPLDNKRFSLKAYFNNNQCRIYTLPIEVEDDDGVVSYDEHVFSRGIWESAKVVSEWKTEYKGYPDIGCAVEFKNGYHISGRLCYEEGAEFNEEDSVKDNNFKDIYKD